MKMLFVLLPLIASQADTAGAGDAQPVEAPAPVRRSWVDIEIERAEAAEREARAPEEERAAATSCPDGTEAFSSTVEPTLKKKQRKARAHVCKVKGSGNIAYEFGQFGDGTLEHATEFGDGEPRTHRTYWPNGKIRSYRSFDGSDVVVETCNGLDGSEVACDLFPFGSSAASAVFLVDSLPKSVGDSSIRFPFSLEPLTHRSALEPEETRCSGRDDYGSTYCLLRESEERSLDLGSFTFDHVTAEWVGTADGQLLGSMVVASEEISDCDRMGEAFATAVGLVKARYGSAGKATRGPKYGSTACKHYMKPGLVYYRVTDSLFRVEVDTSWSDGAYRVELRYTLLPVEKVSLRTGSRRNSVKIYETLKKL